MLTKFWAFKGSNLEAIFPLPTITGGIRYWDPHVSPRWAYWFYFAFAPVGTFSHTFVVLGFPNIDTRSHPFAPIAIVCQKLTCPAWKKKWRIKVSHYPNQPHPSVVGYSYVEELVCKYLSGSQGQNRGEISILMVSTREVYPLFWMKITSNETWLTPHNKEM